MYRFLESIKLKDDEIFNLKWHQQRVNETFAHFFSGREPWVLNDIFDELIFPSTGLWKCRMVFDSIDFHVDILPYQPKKIHSVALQEIGDLEYDFKFENREKINHLKSLSNADEVIFVQNGKITDASIYNLVFWKNNCAYTPSTFLLNGTTRRRLMKQKKVEEVEISVENLGEYSHLSFVNALNDLGDSAPILLADLGLV